MWSDLYNMGLLSVGKEVLDVTMTGHGTFEKRTSPLGKQFIKFITDDN